jgi:hypothetical protein
MADDETASAADEYKYSLFDELFGALNEAPEQDHGKILKSFLLGCVDQMREHSVFQLDLIEKLGSIALDNVQDVRLYSLEARVREIEQGKPITFGQVVGELFFAIALEAAVLVGVTAAAPLLASLGALVLTSIRTAARSPSATRRIQSAVTKLSAIDERRSQLVAQEMRLLERLHFRRPKGKPGKQRRAQRRARKVTLEELQSSRIEMDYLNRNREFYLLKKGEAESERLPEEFMPRYQNIADIKLSKHIETLMRSYENHVDSGKELTRAFANIAQDRYPQIFASPQSSSGQPDSTSGELYQTFTTTQSVTQLIAQCESFKLDVTLHYSQMHAILAIVDDDAVFDAFETLLVMEDVEYNLFDMIGVTEDMLANLEDFVVPMELAIWLVYLEANNLLEREETPSSRSVSGSHSSATTRFIGDDFVYQTTPSFTKPVSHPTHESIPQKLTIYEGQRYAGLRALDENQSYYLFHKFAKKAFPLFADRVPISKSKDLSDFIHKDVANDAFSDVLSMQKVYFLTGENAERRNLVKEMGVVVIEFFNFLREHVSARTSLGFSDAVPEGTAISTLLGNIEKPLRKELPPEEQPQDMSASDWLAEQEDTHLAEWEERVLTQLAELEVDYDQSLEQYQQTVANRDQYLEQFSAGMFDDLFLRPAESQLRFMRSKIEGYMGAVENDEQGRTSDAINARILELKGSLTDSPVEKEMFSTFPR